MVMMKPWDGGGHSDTDLPPGTAWIYARKSFAQSNEKNKKSIEDQIAECLEMCDENGIPVVAETEIFREPKNHGGDEWWEDHSELNLPAMQSARTRPVLTQIMLGIVETRCRALIVWHTDRIHRDVGIAKAFIDLLAKHGVRLFDRNGEVRLATPDQRAAYLNAAVSAQHYREQCAVTSPRGIRRSAKKGTVVTDANILGFRSAGRFTKAVVHMPEEQQKVNEIYDWCLQGLSFSQIGRRLMAESYQWTPDLHEKRGKKRNEFTRDTIYDWQVKRCLTDPRYVGRQRQYKQEWDCPAYLVDGIRPVVETAKWEAVQAIIDARKNGGNAINRTRPLTSLFRCGLCGQPLRAAPANYTPKGSDVQARYWGPVKQSDDSGYWCTHTLPSVREDFLDAYFEKIFAPLLLAEVRDQKLLVGNNQVVADRAVLLRQLQEAERYYNEVLPTFEDITPRLLALKEKACLQKIEGIQMQLRAAESKVMSLDEVEVSLQEYANQTPELKRDTLHAVVRWAALVPNYVPPELSRGNYKKRPDMDRSRIVVLTAFGTYHTLVLDRSGGERGRQYMVRPATPDEVVGTVAEFPDPECFLKGLERSYKGGKYVHNPDTVCPGYTRGAPPMAEFDVDPDDVISGPDAADEGLPMAA